MKRPNALFFRSAAAPAQFPADGLPEVAFLGRSNVGKSSLLNALVGARQLARVSAEPGRTRLVNFFRVDDELYLADLPGYGYAKVPQDLRAGWERMVTSYLLDRPPLALCVMLVDVRREPTEQDEQLRGWLEDNALPYLVAANKVDKLGHSEAARALRALQAGPFAEAAAVVPVSALKGTGVPELWGRVRRAAAEHRTRLRQGA